MSWTKPCYEEYWQGHYGQRSGRKRGLKATSTCPICSTGVPEDEEHLLWRCSAWAQARDPFIADVMLLANGLRLGSLRDWPPCLRLCGIMPDKAVRTIGMDQDSRWRKRCDDLYGVPRSWLFLPEEELEPKRKELQQLAEAGRQWAAGDKDPWEIFVTNLHGMSLAVVRARKRKEDESGLLFPVSALHEKRDTYPWHQLQLPRPHRIPPEILVIGQRPREWKWGPNLLPMVLRWHVALEWLKMPPAHKCVPRAHWQVSFMELALDFEAFAGQLLPPAPRSKYVGGDVSLQEKGRVLRRIVTLLGRATERESVFPVRVTHHCRSLTSMGAGMVMGLEGRPVFTKPTAV